MRVDFYISKDLADYIIRSKKTSRSERVREVNANNIYIPFHPVKLSEEDLISSYLSRLEEAKEKSRELRERENER